MLLPEWAGLPKQGRRQVANVLRYDQLVKAGHRLIAGRVFPPEIGRADQNHS